MNPTILVILYILCCCGQLTLCADTKCPVLPKGCKCNVKKNKLGVRILCNGLLTIPFQDLPSELNADIEISKNQIKYINKTSFPHPNRIRKLVVKDNSIQHIASGSFTGFNTLRKLDLSGNKVSQITHATFQGLQDISLVSLDLRKNRIVSISKRAFNGMKIDKLFLNEQRDIYGKKMSIIIYEDFLTLSFIKTVNLDDINLSCDCNLKWLTTWLHNGDKHVISKKSMCYYPAQLRGKLIQDLTPDWKCGEHNLIFPQLNIQPSVNQYVFKNDSFIASCQSPWLPKAEMEWLSDGSKVVQKTGDVDIQHLRDIYTASYTSTVHIKRLKWHDNTKLSCRLTVRGSGKISTSVNLFISSFNASSNHCLPNITNTERGTMAWPTALDGATVQSSCPFSGSGVAVAYRTCSRGTWSSVNAVNCYFSRNTTAELQKFYIMASERDFRKIKYTGNRFSFYFTRNYLSIKTKYDLYFVYKTLFEIMKTYENANGSYARFFWSSVGLLAESHIELSTMGDVLYGKTGGWRFCDLLKLFVVQESTKVGKPFTIDDHNLVAGISYKQKPKDPIECAILSEPKTQHLQIACENNTATRMSTVSFQVALGSKANQVRITSIVFNVTTFFQSKNKNYSFIASPIVGLEVYEAPLQRNHNTSKHFLVSFKPESLKYHKNPKLVFWKEGLGWTESKDCTSLTLFTNLTQFQCIFSSQFFDNMVYFSLAMDKFVPVRLKAKYMEAILYVGAALSCLLLCVTLLVYMLFRQLRYNRSDAATLMNLCLALIFTEIIFAVGIHRTDHKLLCQGVAVVLHYFMLSTLIWLGCGALVLIQMLRKYTRSVGEEYDPVLKYYLVAWGIPLIICSITVATLKDGPDDLAYCWLPRNTSLGAFVVPAGLFFVTDFILLCYLHALINRVFPEPLEPVTKEEPVDRDKCNPKSCKYKLKAAEKFVNETPKREELLHFLHGSLFVLLFFILTFTCTLMMYAYKTSSSRYLYYFFCYAAAFFNLCIGVVIFLYHFFKRKDAVNYVTQFVAHLRHQKHAPGTELEELIDLAGNHTPTIERNSTNLDHAYERSDIVSEHNSNNLDMTHGVYGLSDQLQSEGSQIIASVRVETAPAYDGRGESLDDLDNVNKRSSNAISLSANESDANIGNPVKETLDKRFNKTQQSQSELSDADKRSNGGQNSIGECSLTSSRTKRVRPKNPDIPENIKSFVPENWRPARRRGKKGGSYYPYFLSETAPVTASLAYSSKSSSLASTTVSGVPLYINKKRAANNLAMYNDLFAKNRPQINPMAPIRQPLPPSNIPMHIVPGPGYPMHVPPSPGYSHISNHQTHAGLTMLNPVQEQNVTPSSIDSNSPDMALNNNKPAIGYQIDEKQTSENINDNTDKVDEIEDEEEDELPVVVAPIIYVPMPHVTKKQFEWRSETTV